MNLMLKDIQAWFDETRDLLSDVSSSLDFCSAVEESSNAILRALTVGNKILIAGNGGSAADAQHMAAEFVGRFYPIQRDAFSAIALTTDTSVLTAVANDYGFENIFSRQIEAHGKPGDVFIAISTSGNSANILRALSQCRVAGITTIGLTGASSKMEKYCDHFICVPAVKTYLIQQIHLVIEHLLCSIVERKYLSTRI